jgi:hypothetical protein
MKKGVKLFLWLAGFFFLPAAVSASHVGDYYDNRDSDHAKMATSSHPGLTYMSSGSGFQRTVITGKTVFGNASLAVTTGLDWGSLNRVNGLRSSTGMTASYNLYINNNAYWHPEHRDHDEVDYFFAMSPTLNNSQGSSGSEIDEMHNWFYTLDAFPIETKNLLVQKGLIVPTIQMIARRTRVASDELYLTGAAHPNAFDNFNNRASMTEMALGMTANKIPPMVKLKVIEEDYNLVNDGTNFFEPTYLSKEKVFDTPVSISRVFHGRDYTRKMVVSAEDSYDANGLALTYHWSVIRGEDDHVRITPLNQSSSRVEILIDYHDEALIPGSTRPSNLVTVGAFVRNGYYYSAPAFVNSYTKRNEKRTYNTSTKKLERIDYNANQVDPAVSYPKSWASDEFSYDQAGNLSGWKRIKDGVTYYFTKEGYLIETKTANGSPDSVSKVSYSFNSTDRKVFWQKSGTSFKYSSAPVCISWTYSEWGSCVDGIKRRQIITSSPTGCSGGTPLLESRECSLDPSYSKADVNHDGQITTADALLALRRSLGLPMSGTAWFESDINGDVDCSRSLTTADALLILRKSLGLSMTGTGWCEK